MNILEKQGEFSFLEWNSANNYGWAVNILIGRKLLGDLFLYIRWVYRLWNETAIVLKFKIPIPIYVHTTNKIERTKLETGDLRFRN
jgi:hypothetical protein